MLTKDVKLATWRMNNAKATMLVIVLSLAKTWALIYTERCHCATIDATSHSHYRRYPAVLLLPPLRTPWSTTINVTLETTRIFHVSLPVDGLTAAKTASPLSAVHNSVYSTIYTDIEYIYIYSIM